MSELPRPRRDDDPGLPSHACIAIVGAGFAGLGRHPPARRGPPDFVVLERGDEVGGTWRDNTYPGCACDIPSHMYSFSFAPEPGLVAVVLAAAGDPRLPRAAAPTTTTCAATSASARR